MREEVIYNKLVRDNIPAIIEREGKTPVCHTATGREYDTQLLAKLAEEISEFKNAPCAEELADIMEVIHALRARYGFPWSDINTIRKRKKKERGGFARQIILEKVIAKTVKDITVEQVNPAQRKPQ